MAAAYKLTFVVLLLLAILPASCYFWREPVECKVACSHPYYKNYKTPAIEKCCKKFTYDGEELFDSRCKGAEPRCNYDKHIKINYGLLPDDQRLS